MCPVLRLTKLSKASILWFFSNHNEVYFYGNFINLPDTSPLDSWKFATENKYATIQKVISPHQLLNRTVRFTSTTVEQFILSNTNFHLYISILRFYILENERQNVMAEN